MTEPTLDTLNVKSITFELLFQDLLHALETDPLLKRPYRDEPTFERAVWDILRRCCVGHFGEDRASEVLLCSHNSLNLPGRSQARWDAFLAAGHADLSVFGAKKRVDIAVRHPDGQMIGIEVECLTQAKAADALVIGLGQTLLALGHRDRAILVAHCGNSSPAQCGELCRVAAKVSEHPSVRVVLLP